MLQLNGQLDCAWTEVSERSRVFLVENELEDNFPNLLKRSGFKDGGDYLALWKGKNFEKRGYSDVRHYAFRFLRSRNSIPLRILLGSVQVPLISHATTRELLKFAINHSDTVHRLIHLKEKVIVGLGRDDLTDFRDIVPALMSKKGESHLVAFPRGEAQWNFRHVVLVREGHL